MGAFQDLAFEAGADRGLIRKSVFLSTTWIAPTKGAWSEEDVRNVITNPIYAGIGPYPSIVPDEQWIGAVSKLIKERGAERVMKDVLRNLREAFPTR